MHNRRKTDRVEHYSDAVLAIAATLLATELHKPEGNTELLQAIASQWPAYAAFAASFLFICIAWTNHHNMYKYIRQTDQYLLLWNIFLLLLITLQSFTTGLLARYVGKPEERTAALIYHATLVLMTLSYNAVWWRAIKAKGLLEKDTDPGLVRLLTIEYAIAPALLLVAFIICLWSVPLSIVPIVLLYVYFALPRLSEKTGRDKNEFSMPQQQSRYRRRYQSQGNKKKEFSIL